MRDIYFAFLCIVLFILKLLMTINKVISMLFDEIKDEIEELSVRLIDHRENISNENKQVKR